MDEAVRQQLVSLLPRLRRFAYGLTGSVDDGDDLVQSACERALTRLDQWQPGTRLDSWMYRIVQTVWIDRIRTRRRREGIGEGPDPDSLPGGDLDRELEARSTLVAVHREVARLPDDQRAVLLLVSVEGLSYRQAAETLDVPIGTVMSRLARARLALGKALADAPNLKAAAG